MRIPGYLPIVLLTMTLSDAVIADIATDQPGQQPAQPASPAPAIKLPPETLDKLLAPVALYPDQLLSQMLICAGNPARVQELSGWLIRQG